MSASAHRARIPVVDLFAGAGGLGEGFYAFGQPGEQYFRVALSVEKNPAAIRTLRLRALFRMFERDSVPEQYFRFISGSSHDQAITDYINGTGPVPCEDLTLSPSEVVFPADIGADADTMGELHGLIHQARAGARHWVLIGGPPCQPFSTAGRTRRRAIPGFDPETDERNFLYRQYLQIIATHWPAVFVMENVRGITSFRIGGELIFGQILRDLADPAAAVCSQDGRRHRYLIQPVVAPEASGAGEGDFGRFIIESEHFGIPQRRHRVILLGVRDDLQTGPALLRRCSEGQIGARAVLAGLPPLRAGIARTPRAREQLDWIRCRHGAQGARDARLAEAATDGGRDWLMVMRSAADQPWFRELREQGLGAVQSRIDKHLDGLTVPARGRGSDRSQPAQPPRWRADWYTDARLDGVCNHSTREHMPGDLHRYLFAAAFAEVEGLSPRLRDFPPSLRPAHANIGASLGHDMFSDRFRVQRWDVPATTVMNHLAKDGHYFIHPDPAQARSLTVREAARLQTFPDHYFFCGNRSQQYTQVGNAVPPLLAKQIAGIVAQVLDDAGH